MALHSHCGKSTSQPPTPSSSNTGSQICDFISPLSGHSATTCPPVRELAVVVVVVVVVVAKVVVSSGSFGAAVVVVSSVVTTTAVDVDPLLDDVIVVVASVASVVSAALSVVAAALEVTVLDDSVLALSVAAELEVESSGASAPPANSVVVVTVEDVVVGSYYMNKNRIQTSSVSHNSKQILNTIPKTRSHMYKQHTSTGSAGLDVVGGSVGFDVTGGFVGLGVGSFCISINKRIVVLSKTDI